MNSNQISKAVRLALVAGAVSAVAAPAAFAADDQSTTTTTTTTTNNSNSTNLGKIEVTGTRIKRTDVETAQPVTILTQAQLKQTGLTSIGDILQSVTQAGSALNTTFNNGGNGSTNIDLRNLGANRVLVLVNGRRWTPALNGTVDLNTIPVSIIDHVEILQDGASAIYGSDAISGVVNIITVKTYNGAEATAYESIYNGGGHWDGKVNEYDFTVGSSGDKAGVVMNVGYVNQHEIWAGNRDISKEPIRGVGSAGGSSASPFGRFITVPTATGACPTGVTLTIYGTCDMTLRAGGKGGLAGSATGPSLTNFRDFAGADHYNFAPLNYFVTPNERTSFYAQGHYDLADNLTFTTDILFNKRSSQQSLASSPLFLGLGGSSFVNGQAIGVGATNPYNPFGHTLNGSTSTFNPATQDLLVLLALRPTDSGRRVFNQNVDTAQFTGTFKGYFNLGGNEWDWDLGYTYGDNYETDLTTGLFNTERLATALDSPGVAPCASQPGCVPFNAFGGANGTLTPAMLNYVLFEEHDASERQMRDFTGNINGSLFDMPAGPLGLALGYEYLEFNGFQHPDATVSSGNTSGNVTQPTDGREKTAAEYIEFDIPLVADAPGFKMLDLDLANRWSQFKWFGGTPGTTSSTVVHTANATTGRAALKWQPSDSLLIRASWSQGFRAPSISDLFFGNSDSFPQASDPCAHGTGVVNCGGPHTQPNQQIRSTVGGNASLHPEKATSRAIGFVYNPDFIPGFDFSLDYYKIDLEQQVTAIPVQTILNGCYINNNLQDCSYITVKGGIITDILDTNVNIGGVKTNGMDLATHYKFPSTSAGDFKLGLDWTFLRNYDQTLPNSGSPSGFSTTDLAGSTTGFGGFPKQRANLSLAWNYGNLSATWAMEYISNMTEGCVALMFANNLCSQRGATAATSSNYLGKTIYHDVQGTYHSDDLNTDFTLGIRNILDKQPPTADTAFANSFLPAFYRVPGRQFYGRISVKF
ncbi:MAG TPA: TonB-dependent receptor [Gammaproteobacteria bacterium]|jgi:iron complex outermembrane receptor protein